VPFIDYTGWRPTRDAAAKLEAIDRVNEICRDFRRQGFSITLRQLHYQFVSKGWHPNTDRAYHVLGDLVSNGRRAGLIDWYDVEDRTRYLRSLTHWDAPEDIIKAATSQYRVDLWDGQQTRVEVWVEKDALVDVVGRAGSNWDVPYISCRGYMSDSEMWSAAQRFDALLEGDADHLVLLHLGDHDPSGLDMTRDIRDRLYLFMRRSTNLEVRRIALNMDQIRQYDPPPNPAKITDGRAPAYIAEHGESSWELDALQPQVIVDLIEGEIAGEVDMVQYEARRDEADRQREQLRHVAQRWADVVEHLDLQL
jgi:hypothetical protein